MKPLTRLPDWQLRLEAFAAERQHMPFAWGANDCCFFAADAVLAITGRDLVKSLRGSYSTPAGARRRLRARGGVKAIASKLLGSSVPSLAARVGDIVLVSVGGEDALGLCNGSSILGPSAQGTRAYGMDVAVAAWRVG